MFPLAQAPPLAHSSDAEKEALRSAGWTLLCPYKWAIAEYDEKDCEDYIAMEVQAACTQYVTYEELA